MKLANDCMMNCIQSDFIVNYFTWYNLCKQYSEKRFDAVLLLTTNATLFQLFIDFVFAD